MVTSASSPEIRESALRYEGWRVVLAAFFGVMVGFSSVVIYTFSVFLKPLTRDFGWSREAVSTAFAVAAMTVAVVSPLLGRLLDRLPPRRIVLPATLVLGAAFASLALTTDNLARFYVTFFAIGLVGNATTQMGYSRAVTSWFTRNRGMALAVVMGGVGVGSIVMPSLAQRLIDSYGWRVAYAAIGSLMIAMGAPLTAIFLRNRGDGEAFAKQSTAAEGATVSEAMRSRVFWVLCAVLFLSSVTANGAVAHLSAALTDRGITTQSAALAASILGGCSLAGRFATGWCLDRFSPRLVSFLLLLAMAAGVLLLASADEFWTGAAGAGLIGLGMGGEADVTPFLLSRHYGLRAFSTLYGLTWTAYAVAGAMGPVLVGRAYDAAGSYSSFLAALSVPALISALLFLLIPATATRR